MVVFVLGLFVGALNASIETLLGLTTRCMGRATIEAEVAVSLTALCPTRPSGP